MSNQRALIAVSLLLAIAGCDRSLRTPETVPIAEVINKVKDEVLVFYQSPIKVARPAPDDAVCKKDGNNTVELTPKSVKLTLKTVATKANDATAGLKAPSLIHGGFSFAAARGKVVLCGKRREDAPSHAGNTGSSDNHQRAPCPYHRRPGA